MLDENEKEIIQKVMEREQIQTTENIKFDRLNTIYIVQGNFTICILEDMGEFIIAGVTKRNPLDVNQKEVGRNRALSNAIKNMFE